MSNVDNSHGSPGREEAQAATEEMELDEAFVRMGQIIEELEELGDESVKEKVFELLDWVDAFHREAVGRIAGLLPLETLGSLREDPVVERLLETYVDEEEEPEDLAATLEDALDEIRPYLHSHGGEMEVLDVSDGVVRLRLMGSCDGCPSSTLTLTQGVEKILRERWPSFRGIEVEGAEEEETPTQQKLLSIQSMRRE